MAQLVRPMDRLKPAREVTLGSHHVRRHSPRHATAGVRPTLQRRDAASSVACAPSRTDPITSHCVHHYVPKMDARPLRLCSASLLNSIGRHGCPSTERLELRTHVPSHAESPRPRVSPALERLPGA